MGSKSSGCLTRFSPSNSPSSGLGSATVVIEMNVLHKNKCKASLPTKHHQVSTSLLA